MNKSPTVYEALRENEAQQLAATRIGDPIPYEPITAETVPHGTQDENEVGVLGLAFLAAVCVTVQCWDGLLFGGRLALVSADVVLGCMWAGIGGVAGRGQSK